MKASISRGCLALVKAISSCSPLLAARMLGPSSASVPVTYDKLAEYRKPPSALLRRAVETSLELIAYNFMNNGKN